MTLYVETRHVERLHKLISNIQEHLELNEHTEITLNLSKNIKKRIDEISPVNEYYELPPDLSYSILSFLAFSQTFFAAKVKESGYGNTGYVAIYWEALSLKDHFRGGYSK